jgi:hypothetical protein
MGALPIINCYGVDCTGWKLIHPRADHDMLGYVPRFLVEADQRPAKEQFAERYEFGGWRPNPGFEQLPNGHMQYPGDPALPPIAERRLRDERIVMFPGALFAIFQPDGSFEMARID